MNRDLTETKSDEKANQARNPVMMPKIKREPFVQQFTNKNQSVFLRKMRYHQRRRSPVRGKLPPLQ